MALTLVIPSKTKEYLHTLIGSLNSCQPGWQYNSRWQVVVANNGLPADYASHLAFIGAKVIGISDPFIFAKAINQGVRHGLPDSDIMIMNDDAYFTSASPLKVAEDVMARAHDERFGVIGTRISGGVGNPDQKRTDIPIKGFIETKIIICFVCALIPRVVWDTVGVLDEDFDGYGYEDDDFCCRASKLGYRLGVTGDISVVHGAAGHPHSSTYAEMYDPSQLAARSKRSKQRFINKWGTISSLVR